jgi:hypothetical protein
MNWAHRLAFYLYEKDLLRFVPWRFLRTYVYPLTVRGPKKPYEPARFFDSYYGALAREEFSDRITIGPRVKPLHSTFHYNCVENSIIRGLLRCPVKENPAVFDLGSGAGHWIDFYRSAFAASYVCGADISQVCVDKLRAKYASSADVAILRADISDKSFRLERKFDVVNAIGVVFHIVDDALWLQALANMRELLSERGVMVVGGHFGWLTQNVQFHRIDEFESYDDALRQSPGGEIRVNKRIRSRWRWKKAARMAGLRVRAVIRTQGAPEILAPENNVMVLERFRTT